MKHLHLNDGIKTCQLFCSAVAALLYQRAKHGGRTDLGRPLNGLFARSYLGVPHSPGTCRAFTCWLLRILLGGCAALALLCRDKLYLCSRPQSAGVGTEGRSTCDQQAGQRAGTLRASRLAGSPWLALANALSLPTCTHKQQALRVCISKGAACSSSWLRRNCYRSPVLIKCRFFMVTFSPTTQLRTPPWAGCPHWGLRTSISILSLRTHTSFSPHTPRRAGPHPTGEEATFLRL